jgi:hypothetical protein
MNRSKAGFGLAGTGVLLFLFSVCMAFQGDENMWFLLLLSVAMMSGGIYFTLTLPPAYYSGAKKVKKVRSNKRDVRGLWMLWG